MLHIFKSIGLDLVHLLFFNNNFKTSRYLQLLYKYSRSRFHQGPEQKENKSLSLSIRDHTVDVTDGLEKEGGWELGKGSIYPIKL